MTRLLLPTLLCLLATASVATREGRQPNTRTTTILRRVETTTQKPSDFRSSPLDLGPRRDERRLEAESFSDDNALLDGDGDGLQAVAAGDGKDAATPNNNKKKKKEDDDDDEDKKTLSQQIADGKYGLIQKEIYSRPSLRPGIISYKTNPEVPRDSDKNLGGLEAEEIWLAEDHVLVLRGGWFPNHSFNKTEAGPLWPPIDNYNAPPRQVKIPARPKVPPPFPIQLTEGGPTEFIGPNGTRSQYPPFFPPQGNFPPGAGFYPPPGNGSLYPPLPPQYPFPPPRNGSFPPPLGNYPQGNFPPPGNYPPPPGRFPPPGNYPYPPKDEQYQPFPYPPPPHGYMPFPNGSSPFGPLPPFLPPLPPGAAFLPPPGNQTDFDEDDPSIYYPPPYDFYYPRDNTTEVPPGPLVPGIILPPPPNFFAPLDDNKSRRPQRPTTTPLSYIPSTRPPSTPPPSPDVAILDVSTPLPPSSTPYGAYLPGANRPTVKRPFLTYVPVTTAVRKKKPRPQTTTPEYYGKQPVEFTTTPPPAYTPRVPPPAFGARPGPPQFVNPQNVQVYHKGESPITSRPYYLDIDNVVTSTPNPIYNGDHIESTPRPEYLPDGLSKLKDILYTTPRPSVTYQVGKVIDLDAEVTPHYVNSVEATTLPAQQYDNTDLTKRPIYVQNFDDQKQFNHDLTSTAKYPTDYEANSVGQPQRGHGNKVVSTYQPQRSPKTTYYFYEEPHFEQGYVRDITTAKPYSQPYPQPQPQPQPQWQYDRRPPRPNIPRPQSAEEMLLAQIVETFRQPGGYNNNNNINNKKPSLPPQNYYSSGGNGQNFCASSRPNGFNIYSTPRPSFYVTRKPDYYSIIPSQSESPLKYNNYNYPYNFEDVVQSTEHPLPLRYNSASGSSSRLKGPDVNVQTSPKTVYEYSFQTQADSKPTFVTRPTERPRLQVQRVPPSFHPIRAPPQAYQPQQAYQQPQINNYRQQQQQQQQQQVDGYQPQQQQIDAYRQQPQQQQHTYQQKPQPTTSVRLRQSSPVQPTFAPLPSNSVDAQYYDQAPPKAKVKYQQTPRPPAASQSATPDPLQHYYTQQDATLLDDITKKYFTIFGQKLPAGGGITERQGTTPLPDAHEPIPLHDDILVNYLHPRPTINPDSEYIDQQHIDDSEDDSSKGGELVSYQLPGNGGGHVYFVTPQLAGTPERDGGGYLYDRPARRLRSRRTKNKQS